MIYIIFVEIYVYNTRQIVFNLNGIPISFKNKYINQVEVDGKILYKDFSYNHKLTTYTIKESEFINMLFIGNNQNFNLTVNTKDSDFTDNDVKIFKMSSLSYKKIINNNCSVYYSYSTLNNQKLHYLIIYLSNKSLLFTVSSTDKKGLLDSVETFCSF